jgi:two-component system, OmpR family, phosphate regulon sensor histidine kinase PhoR
VSPVGDRGGRSVSSRLTGAFATLVVLLVLVAGTGALGLVVAGTTHAREVRLDRLADANTRMLLAMTDAETGVRGYGLVQDRSFLEPYEGGRRDFPVQARLASALAANAPERSLVRRQVSIAHRWTTGYAEVVAAMPPGHVVVSPDLQRANKSAFDTLRSTNDALATLVEARRHAARTAEERIRRGGVVLTGLALALALGVALRTARRTRQALVWPLGHLVGVLQRLADGEHTARAGTTSGPAEVQAVARSVDALADEGDRLRAERAEAARLQRLATQIGRSIRDHIVADGSLQAAVSSLGEGLGADHAHVRLLGGSGLGPAEGRWHAPGLAELSPQATAALTAGAEADLMAELHAAREVVCEPDLTSAAHGDPVVAAAGERLGATALLALPVGAGTEVLGALTLVSVSGPRHWTEHEIALAQSAAADLGRALVLSRLYHQQEELVDQLRSLDRAKTDFLATVSHELRTPLTSIAGYLELIRDGDAGEVPPPMDALLAVVDRNAARLQHLIEDLLTLSRIESGAFRTARGEVSVQEVLATAVDALRPAAEHGHLALELVPPGGPLAVSGDAAALERVALNLLSNAVKFTPAGGRVQVRARADAGWAVLEVEDTGIGIPEEELARMSTRFFRATNATDLAIPGTGLGLTIARSVVEHHGGALEVRSHEGVGTTAVVRLPLLGGSAADAVPDTAATALAPLAR